MNDRQKARQMIEHIMAMIGENKLEEIDQYLKDYTFEDKSHRENLAVLRSTYSIRNKIDSWLELATKIYLYMRKTEEDEDSWFVGLFTKSEMIKIMMKNVLGYCPVCNAEGVSCARNPAGPTVCANGHEYPHAQRVYHEPVEFKPLRIYVDMDGVIADFEKNLKGRNPKEVKMMPGTYIRLDPIEGAIEAVRELINMGHDVWIATKTPTHNLLADSEKKHWLSEHLPELLSKVIITSDKGCLRGDILIDDRKHKANCESFEGCFIHFGTEQFPSWIEVLNYIKGLN